MEPVRTERTRGGFYFLDVENPIEKNEERDTQRVMCSVYYGMRDFISRPINFFHDILYEESSEL